MPFKYVPAGLGATKTTTPLTSRKPPTQPTRPTVSLITGEKTYAPKRPVIGSFFNRSQDASAARRDKVAADAGNCTKESFAGAPSSGQAGSGACEDRGTAAYGQGKRRECEAASFVAEPTLRNFDAQYSRPEVRGQPSRHSA